MDGKKVLAELAKQAQAGSEEAYSGIVKEMHANFLSLAKRMGKQSDTLIDDLYNEGIYSLLKSVPAWEESKGPFLSWATECAKRAMYSHLRRSNRESGRNTHTTGSDIELACDNQDETQMLYDQDSGEFNLAEEPRYDVAWSELSEISDVSCAAVEALHKLDKSQREMVAMVLNGAKLDDIVQWMVDKGHISQETPERLQAGHARMRMRRCLETIADYIRDIDPQLAKEIAITNPLQRSPENDSHQT